MREEIETILENKYPEYKALPIVDDIHAEENPREDFWDNLTERQTYEVNADFLKATGDPKYDYLTCWEPGRIDEENETLFDFPTFYEFDVSWWEFQKEAQYESIEDCKKWMEEGSDHWTPEKVAKSINDLEEKYSSGYEIYCSGDWFRLIENDVFLYAQIISAQWYIYYELESVISDLQNEHLPYSLNEKDMEFIELLNESDPEKKYLAGGREKELDSLQDLIRKYEGQPLLDLISKYMKTVNYSGGTFRFDRGYKETPTEKFDPFTDFIFWDEQSLKNVRTTHFLEDFKKVQLTGPKLNDLICGMKVEVEKDFMEFYNENKSRYIHK